MALQIADQHYLKAQDAMNGLFSDWTEVCESLNYAISYDDNHCPSLTLLGKIYASYLNNLDEAFVYFDKVIAADANYVEVYPEYIKALLWAEETDRAQKLIDYSLKIKTIDDTKIYWCQAYLFETQGMYKEGIGFLKKAKKVTYNDHFRDFLDDEKRRLKAKIEETSPKKKISKKSKNKKKKSDKKSKK